MRPGTPPASRGVGGPPASTGFSGGAAVEPMADAAVADGIGDAAAGNAPMPDRLCNDPASAFYDAALMARGVGIRFNGAEKTNVEEYCVSEGWVRVAAGKTVDRRGRPMTIKLNGAVEAYLKS